MCFLLLHHRVRADAPLVLLANRDEAYERAFDGPVWRPGPPAVLAPRDRRAGGTWLGVREDGLVAALTNRREVPALPSEGLRSRGRLVDDVLAVSGAVSGAAPGPRGRAATASAWAAAHLAGQAYAGFHLLLADGEEAFVLRHPGGAVPRAPASGDLVRLPPGAHVLTNLHDLDEVTAPAEGAPRAGEALDDLLARLMALAADDRTVLPGDHRILKRGERRGTVCSAVLALRAGAGPVDGRLRLHFADGPPDRAPFRVLVR